MAPRSRSDGELLDVALDLVGEDKRDRVLPRALQAAELGDKPIDYLINNAGVGSRAGFEALEFDQFERILQVNTISPLRVPRGYARQAYNPSIVALPAAVRAGRGGGGAAAAPRSTPGWPRWP